MKLIIAVVQDYDCDRLLRAVTEAGLRATRIASTGGFLRTGNTTVLMGVADDQVARSLEIIGASCRSRVETRPDPATAELAGWYAAGIDEVSVGGAVVFVAAVSRFERINW